MNRSTDRAIAQVRDLEPGGRAVANESGAPAAPFDFDAPVERQGTHSLKWDLYQGRDIIPLWVADMDFRCPPPVVAALQERVAHGIFGYTHAPRELAEVLVARLEEIYGWKVQPEWFVWLPGVVSGINLSCRCAGDPGDAVATFTPVYPPFLSAPRANARTLISVDLCRTADGYRNTAPCLL